MKLSYKALLLVCSCLLILFYSPVGASMFGLFKKYDVHLCPEVKGRILDHGKPVEGLIVKRWLVYVDEIEREDSVITDENGEFYFPEKNIKSKLPGRAFVENLTRQAIYIEYQGTKLPLWRATLFGYFKNSAFSKKLQDLNCDVNDPAVDFEFENPTGGLRHYANSICRWSDDFYIY